MASLLSTAFNLYPLAMRFLVLVAFPLLLVIGYVVFNLKQGLPGNHITLTNKALTAPVSVGRDEHGVPHIDAKNDNDAFFAIGYVHAQDRLWQLELQRRMGQGRLSEIFGRTSVAQDTWLRTLGLYHAAKLAWPALSQAARESLSAYAAGINAGMAAQTTLPLEFRILGVKPEPWSEIDSLAWIKLFALDLGGNFRKETARFVANQTLSHDELATFFPEYPLDGPGIPKTAQMGGDYQGLFALLALQKDLEQSLCLGGRAVGSNAWVVAGRHTANGALLANDPHLALQAPSLWYVLAAKGKALNVSGMSMVGLPLVIFGHNEHIAWGGTNMMADTQDLFLLRTDPANPDRYEMDRQWEKFGRRVELINVRADLPEMLHKEYRPIKIEVRSTRHGPVISDQFNVYGQMAALRWTALGPGDTSYEAFYRLGFATDWPSFKDAMKWHVAPTLNMLYADRQGNIGSLGAGSVPLRKKGDGAWPAPGWNQEFEWRGFIPPERWPQTYNPQAGYIISANHKIVDDGYPYFISRDWASPARARRIEQLLTAKIDGKTALTASGMQQIQGDTLDLEAQGLLAEVIKMTPVGADQQQAFGYLKQWHGDMSKDSQAAAIFNVWMRHFKERLFRDRLHGYWNQPEQASFIRELEHGVSFDTLKTILRRQNSPWCGPGHVSCDDLLQASLKSALAELNRFKRDSSMQRWQWGAFQQTVYPHMPFSHIKPLDKLFEPKIGNGGSENSINVAANTYVENKGYLQSFGAGFRQVVSLDRRRIVLDYMNSTGQSGNVMSPHYDDMVTPFRDVRFYQLIQESAPNSDPAATGPDRLGAMP